MVSYSIIGTSYWYQLVINFRSSKYEGVIVEVPKEADRTVLQIKTKSGCDVLIEYSKCWVVKKKNHSFKI